MKNRKTERVRRRALRNKTSPCPECDVMNIRGLHASFLQCAEKHRKLGRDYIRNAEHMLFLAKYARRGKLFNCYINMNTEWQVIP